MDQLSKHLSSIKIESPDPEDVISISSSIGGSEDDLPEYYDDLHESHPWESYIRRKINRPEMNYTTADIPTNLYKHVPIGGYSNVEFVNSVFPIVAEEDNENACFIDKMCIEDAIRIRMETAITIQNLIRRQYAPAHTEFTPVEDPMRFASSLDPIKYGESYPVLYQVVAKWGNGVILEAKDFLIPGPNRYDLRFVMLDQKSFNVVSGCYGYNLQHVSIKDFVYIYHLGPTKEAIKDINLTLELSRRRAHPPIDHQWTYAFRAESFTFVTPTVRSTKQYGIVLKKTRGGVLIAVEGFPDFISVPGSFIDENTLITVDIRPNVSSAVRFSEFPSSDVSRDQLIEAVRTYPLSITEESAMAPFSIERVANPEDITDRIRDFAKYNSNKEESRFIMSRIFTLGLCGISAVQQIDQDIRVHGGKARFFIKSLPLKMTVHTQIKINTGWSYGSTVLVRVRNGQAFRMKIQKVVLQPNLCRIEMITNGRSEQFIQWAAVTQGRRLDNGVYEADVSFRLEKALPDQLCRHYIDKPNIWKATGLISTILDGVYGNTRMKDIAPIQVSIPQDLLYKNEFLNFSEEQLHAIKLGCSSQPIVAIQAAFGTGKTVTGAIIAGLLAGQGKKIVVTATTNHAIAQFVETFESFTEFVNIPTVRFISESAAHDPDVQTESDMEKAIRDLLKSYGEMMSPEQAQQYKIYQGLQTYLDSFSKEKRDGTKTEAEWKNYAEMERHLKRMKNVMVRMVFDLHKPQIIYITTASLLLATAEDKPLYGLLDNFNVIIGDEASQIPEAMLLAIGSTLPKAKHVYIGDVNQLPPFVKGNRQALQAQYGAIGLMDTLINSKAVCIAPLLISYRAHPMLNDLPNTVFYDRKIINGTSVNARNQILNLFPFPNPSVPFIFVNLVSGESKRNPNMSYYNKWEARICLALIDRLVRLGVPSRYITVMTFYRGQHMLLDQDSERIGFNLATVDSSQGREHEIVILLTTITPMQERNSIGLARFISDRKRMNVALTRCRLAQFVLGNANFLVNAGHWGDVIRWADMNGTLKHENEMFMVEQQRH